VGMERLLLVDVGNSSTKVVWSEGARFEVLGRAVLATGELTAGRLGELTAGWDYGAACVASVVPGQAAEVVELCGGRVRVFELGWRSRLGIGLDYPRPESIGADRLANAVAAVARMGSPVVVVDSGTAVTFDVVSGAGDYVGGVIAPGLDLMIDYLAERTALLPRVELARPEAAVGRSTEQAMRSGAYHGYRGMVGEILARVCEELVPGAGGRVPVVATGGHAGLIFGDMAAIDAVLPDLTMEGLHLVARLELGGEGETR